MSQYTTGEIARLCGVTVRTVQYYDSRDILTPSELTEGGRRLYSEEDVKRLKVICMLRELGLSINVIGQLFREEDPASVIDVLLGEQEKALKEEIAQRQTQLDRIAEMQKGLRGIEHFSMESIGDVAQVMENKKLMNKLYKKFVLFGIAVEVPEWAAVVLWIKTGIWWPFALCLVLMIPAICWFIKYYYRKVAYICPQCHNTFKPSLKEFTFANHTLRTRKLTCVCCGHKGFCVETLDGDAK